MLETPKHLPVEASFLSVSIMKSSTFTTAATSPSLSAEAAAAPHPSTYHRRCVFCSRHTCVTLSRSTRSILGTAQSWSLVSDPCSCRLSFLCPCLYHPCSCPFPWICPCRLCQTRNLTLLASGRPPFQRFHHTSATSLRTHVTSHALHCTMHVHWKELASGCVGRIQASVPAPLQPIYRQLCPHNSLSDRG